MYLRNNKRVFSQVLTSNRREKRAEDRVGFIKKSNSIFYDFHYSSCLQL